MAFSPELVSRLHEILAAMNLKYSFEDDGECGLFTLRMKMNCRLQNVSVALLVREDNFSALATLPLSADENCRLAVAEYLTRVNFNMRNGNFEMNMDDGVIRFKSYHHAGDAPLDEKAARLTVLMPMLMVDRFGNALVDVLFGLKSPREAYESIGQ